jgi:hypothetical protein
VQRPSDDEDGGVQRQGDPASRLDIGSLVVGYSIGF